MKTEPNNEEFFPLKLKRLNETRISGPRAIIVVMKIVYD